MTVPPCKTRLAGYVAGYAFGFADLPIRSDGINHYVYLPSTLLLGDPTLDALARDCCGGQFPYYTDLIRWPGSDGFLDPHPIHPGRF